MTENVTQLPGEAEQRQRFNLVPFSALTPSADPGYLVKGLLPATGMAVAWGPPGCGKSFWALDAALHVALGWEYGGRRVRQVPVAYIAGEGQAGLSRRVEAFRQAKMTDPPGEPAFWLIGEPLDLASDHAELVNAIRVQATEPGLVVLDTLNRTLQGSENDPADMGRYIAAADAIRDALSCCVLVVHHCGHEQSRPRGHTSLTAAADAQFAVAATGELRTLDVDKAKDAPAGERLTFKLEPIQIGYDGDGDGIESCYVTEADGVGGQTSASEPSGKTGLALQLLRQAIQEAGQTPPTAGSRAPADAKAVGIELWRRYCREGGLSATDSPEARKKAFQRALERLQQQGWVAVWNDWVWLP